LSDLFAAADARQAAATERSAAADTCFIEQQLPISKLSKETYKERKSNAGQTLTALGSYWKGRKPLILVRAVILGLLLPATDDPARDRAIFLKLMLMDDAGLRKRKAKSIPVARARQLLPAHLHDEAFDGDRWSRRLSRERRSELEILAFDAMGLDEKLTYSVRPEELPDSALDDVWPEVNAHLGTHATSLPELVRQLGERRFGHLPRVGDPFCGGGSIPFEAARLSCDVYASDLNPIACLLTWGALNIVGGSDETRARIAEAQARIVAAVDRQIVELGFEHDGFYPVELRLPYDAPTRFPHGWKVNRKGEPVAPETPPYTVTCPQTGWRVPMVSTFQVHEQTKTILDLVPDPDTQACRLVPRQGVSDDEWQWAEEGSVIRELGDWFLAYEGPLLHDDSPPEDCLYHVRIPSRAKAYLYCLETRCPKTGWMVPMAPSRVISKNYRTVARLVPDPEAKRFRIEVVTGVTDEEIAAAEAAGTVKDRALRYTLDGREYVTPITAIRGDVELRSRYPDAESRARDEERLRQCRNRYSATAGNELRRWEKSDIVPRDGDIFQERLYCIQWSRPDGSLTYAGVTDRDEERERQVTRYVQERLAEWQAAGLVPDSEIEPGTETTRLYRERGWTHWHHLFNPRHLLIGALIRQTMTAESDSDTALGVALSYCATVDRLSKLTQWRIGFAGSETTAQAADSAEHVFHNQALNTFYNYGSRATSGLWRSFSPKLKKSETSGTGLVRPLPSSEIQQYCNIWISDPPYADAIQYHEITEYFLAWLRSNPPRDDWIWDSRRALAITGEAAQFRESMVAAYSAMARHMPDNGLQVVMFTHQDVGVWATLAEILAAAGLQVTAGWCIATETDKAFSEGNYVQGTVLLILRKRVGEERGYLARLQKPVEDAVREQLATMQALDDREQPNFGDADYQLAAYTAALKVLTRFAVIDGRPVADLLEASRDRGEVSAVERLLGRARQLASDFLLPEGLPRSVWDDLKPEERFYLKGLELEQAGEVRAGAYQEMARGFGIEDYRAMLASARANQVRMKTAAEFGRRDLRRAGTADRAEDAGLDAFAAGVVRHCLYAVTEAARADDLPSALRWFHASLGNEYWNRRQLVIGVLDYLAQARSPARATEAEVAAQLAGAVRNDRP
jgi:adenine-specific DNA methylase